MHEPGEGDLAVGRVVLGSHVVDRAQDPPAAVVGVVADPRRAWPVTDVALAAVLAGEEAGAQREVGQAGEAFALAEVAHRTLVFMSHDQVVVRLQCDESRQTHGIGDRQCLR